MSMSNKAMPALRKKKHRRLEGMDIFSAAVLTVFVILIAFPFYTAIITSFTTSMSYVKQPIQLIPNSFTLENYEYAFDRMDVLRGYKNTLFIVAVGTVIGMVISLTYSYALSMKAYPGKKLAFIFLLITMYFGGGLIPTYLLIRDLKLINNPFAIIFLHAVSPFNIIIMKNGIDQLPASLMEAGRIDGANEWQTFVHIVVPLIKPIVVTFSLFTAVGYWNEWYWSMIVLTKPAVKTLQIMLRTIVANMDAADLDMANTDYVEVFSQGLKMASVVITMVPIMIVYPFLQKHFAAGILVGAVKM